MVLTQVTGRMELLAIKMEKTVGNELLKVWEEDGECSFRYVKFEMSIRCPSGISHRPSCIWIYE